MSRYIVVSECGLDKRMVDIPQSLMVDKDIKPCSIEEMIAMPSADTAVYQGDQIKSLEYCVKNQKIHKSLLNFLNTRGFNVNPEGKLIYKGKLYNVDILEHFIDLCDGGKRPLGSKLLYPLLINEGLKDVHYSRTKYFK